MPNGNTRTFTAVVEYDPESKMYIGTVPALPEAHTQAPSLDELNVRLKEVIELCLEHRGIEYDEQTHFIGLQQISVAV
ncbi:MAG: type II toxin-antitoxin system HicB family antitoxin [Calditrichaeota bacterium]|nr:type II toxin-antitoxin system HicB family antitoxin [Calditrichota bacterium]MCB9369134.1 type II toxin-antitoxin system HicB family antitoxin [Calditrichota bacterium]